MVYNYICKFPKVQGENVRKAIELVTLQGYSHQKAADATGVTKSVLQRYLKKPDKVPDVLSQGSIKPVFNADQEKMIIAYVYQLANQFYAMSRKSLGELAFHLAEENGLKHPFKHGTAGREWIVGFLIRHQDKLAWRTGTPTSLVRITSFTKSAVYRFVDQLEDIIRKRGYTPNKIFNADESGITIVPNRSPKRLARKGVPFVPVMTPVERGQLVTIMCCASVEGHFIPPMFVFPDSCKDTNISLSPTGSLFARSKKGWGTSDTFCIWLKLFRTHATQCRQDYVLVIVDNHGSHISYEAVKYAEKHKIDILTLPPHTTHKLQPLDVGFFSPLKGRYSQVLTEWQARNRGIKPRTEIIPQIIKPAYEESCKESTMRNAFNKTGIWDKSLDRPNRYVFDDSEFSDTTSIEPLLTTEGENANVNQPQFEVPAPAIGNSDNDMANDNDEGDIRSTTESLVPYGSSSDEEENEEFDMVSVGIQVDATDLIYFSERELASAQDEIEVVLPSYAASSINQPSTSAFRVTPWDLDKQDIRQPEAPKKTRAKGSSELITSEENLAKLKEKHQKRKKKSSDSEEGVTTRGATKAQKLVLRSDTRSSSSSQ